MFRTYPFRISVLVKAVIIRFSCFSSLPAGVCVKVFYDCHLRHFFSFRVCDSFSLFEFIYLLHKYVHLVPLISLLHKKSTLAGDVIIYEITKFGTYCLYRNNLLVFHLCISCFLTIIFHFCHIPECGSCVPGKTLRRLLVTATS